MFLIAAGAPILNVHPLPQVSKIPSSAIFIILQVWVVSQFNSHVFDFKRQSGLITDRVCSIWSNSWRFLAGPFFSSSLFVSCRQRLSPSIIFTKRMSNFFISFPPQICILLIGKISQFGLKVLFFIFVSRLL